MATDVADLNDLPWASRAFLRAYRWRSVDPLPWIQLKKPLDQCRVAIVSTAGLVMPAQAGFDDSVRGGDWSLREIPDDADPRTMRLTHRSESFDPGPVEQDANIAFPLDRLHELVASGEIGAANVRHFSFMGSLTATSHLVSTSAPQAARALAADGVDVALLIPI
jgi:D-proline reductase (dithiol) PrdB